MAPMKKYSLTEEHRAQLVPWASKWIANAMSTKPMDDEDRAVMRRAVRGLYESAGLKPPPDHRIVFVPSPLVLRLAGGFAAAIWHLRKQGQRAATYAATDYAATDDAATDDDATRAATDDATYDATRAATDAASDAATYAATYDATRAATDAATYAATYAATRAATYAATYDATRAATDDATYAATRAATDAASDAATRAATDAATYAATDDATRAATYDATRAATYAATYAASDAATRAATDAASDAATYAATDAATYAATYAATRAATSAATYDATRDATDDATRAATRAATDDATYAATRAATDAASDAATRAATDAATYAATYDATRAATYAATRDATDADSESEWYRFPNLLQIANSVMGSNLAKFGLSCAAQAWNMWQGGNQWSAWASWLSFFREIVKLGIDYTKWQHWEDATIHAGPRIMHAEFCMISDRPVLLTVDDRNRPHAENGPFCRWADGTELYSWHGVRVPAKYFLREFTAQQILSEPNAEVRRALIERYDFLRHEDRAGAFMADCGARVLDSAIQPMREGAAESLNELLELELPGDQDGKMVAVRVTDPSTDRQYMLRVHPELRPMLDDQEFGDPQEMTVRNAIASTFGMRGDEYLLAQET